MNEGKEMVGRVPTTYNIYLIPSNPKKLVMSSTNSRKDNEMVFKL